MTYYDLFLARFKDKPPAVTDKTDETPARQSGRTYGEALTEPTKPGSVSFVSDSHKESVDFSTPWPPRPAELANWPVDRRQRWGELANRLEADGVPFPESERRAFREVKAMS
jgi:hypothetical protein